MFRSRLLPRSPNMCNTRTSRRMHQLRNMPLHNMGNPTSTPRNSSTRQHNTRPSSLITPRHRIL